jgi:PIN domain nuclease of toxin-antitoxin system
LIVVDTQAWYWWVMADARLSKPARAAIEQADAIGISIVSCIEFARIVERKRIVLDRHPVMWMREAIDQPGVHLLEITIELAHKAAALDWAHRDPSDRMIVATAIAHDAPIVSKDDRIRMYRPARAIW